MPARNVVPGPGARSLPSIVTELARKSGDALLRALNQAARSLATAGRTPEVMDLLGDPGLEAVEAHAASLLFAMSLITLHSLEAAGHPDAPRLADSLRLHMEQRSEQLDDPTLSTIAGAMAMAHWDPGPVMAQRLAGLEGRNLPPVTLADLRKRLSRLAREMSDDPVLLHEHLSRLPAAGATAKFTALLARHPRAALREAAAGFVLTLPPDEAGTLLDIIAEDAKPSAAHVARLRLMRHVLPEALLGRLDRALAALESRAPAAGPAALPRVIDCICSMPDGVGAQSLAAMLRIGRRHGFVALLLKQGHGLKDAIVQLGMSQAEAAGRIDAIEGAMLCCNATPDLLRLRLPAALAENEAAAQPPAFAVVEALRLLGITTVEPDPRPLHAILDDLLTQLPAEQRDDAAMHAARKALPGLDHDMLNTWFEGDAVALRELAGVKTGQKEALLLTRLLPARRADWAWRCIWAAAALIHDGAPEAVDDGAQLALIARDLLGEVPMAEIALMRHIAQTSIQAARRAGLEGL